MNRYAKVRCLCGSVSTLYEMQRTHDLTFVVPPATTILLDYSAIQAGITSIEQLWVTKTVWYVWTVEFRNFLELPKLPAKRDMGQIGETSVPVDCHSETRKIEET